MILPCTTAEVEFQLRRAATKLQSSEFLPSPTGLISFECPAVRDRGWSGACLTRMRVCVRQHAQPAIIAGDTFWQSFMALV